jgi:adenylate cyclase
MKKNMIKAIAGGNLAVVLLSFLVFAIGMLSVLNNSVFDYNMSLAMSQQPHEDIIVVEIDDKSIKEIGKFPFDRKIYAPFVQELEKSGAKVIAFDVTFNAQSNPESDQIFAQELAKYNNIIIPSYANLESGFSRSTIVQKDQMIMAQSVERPLPLFANITQTAHINRAIDSDGVIRRTWLALNTPDGPIYSLAYKTAEMSGYNVKHFLDLHPQKEIIINYEAGQKDFMNVPFYKVLDGSLPKNFFKDRIVLIGQTGPGTDEGITPIERHMNLVYAHANILNQLLHNQSIQKADDLKVTFPLMLLVLAFIGFVTWRMKPVLSVSTVFATAVILLVGQFFIYNSSKLVLNVIDPIFAGFIAFTVNIAIKTYFETKQKNYITKQFGRYISPDLVKEIAASGQEIKLGGSNRELTILFLDIRGFTPLSEKMQPEEVVGFLNMMFDMITKATLENKGTIDKFIGDAAMLLFNAPLDVEHHPYYAVKTGYDIQQGMIKVRQDIQEKFGVEVAVGIGINTGNVVVGNIGSYLRVDYTAIGDNVNTAARIESNTERHQILVSDSTYEATKEYFEYECIGQKIVKGKSVPLTLYEVKGHIKAPV